MEFGSFCRTKWIFFNGNLLVGKASKLSFKIEQLFIEKSQIKGYKGIFNEIVKFKRITVSSD